MIDPDEWVMWACMALTFVVVIMMVEGVI